MATSSTSTGSDIEEGNPPPPSALDAIDEENGADGKSKTKKSMTESGGKVSTNVDTLAATSVQDALQQKSSKINDKENDDDCHDEDGITIAGTEISDANNNLPEFLICPIKRELLVDPVVLSDGMSYERSAVVEQRPGEPVVYPNRSLASILSELQKNQTVTASRGNNTIADGSLGRAVVNKKSFIPKQSFLQQAKKFLTANEDRPLPQALYCPITLGIMHEPVIDPSGFSYEKVAIVNWIYVNGDSPVTRNALTVEELVPNHSISQLLQSEVDRDNVDDIHPALRRWKNEPTPQQSNTNAADAAVGDGGNDPEIGANTASASTSASTDRIRPAATLAFPTTRVELEAQMEEGRRRRQNKMKCRIAAVIVFLMIIVACFFVPLLAAIVVVLLLAAVGCTMSNSATNHSFR
mmetsp:Transcript_58422/g.142886  ORF Transcript_58422/g.142886 Transcript_58422/m.142886 type:complete len:410 (-) Transcript_58422:1976-3205(-)